MRLAGWSTLRVDLLGDLLGDHERQTDIHGAVRFDIDRITRRLAIATRWCLDQRVEGAQRIALFGASTGAAAAIGVAATLRRDVAAVVSRGGRIDLAADHLPQVRAPTLLVLGGADRETLRRNRDCARRLGESVTLRVVPGAGYTSEESGALGCVGERVATWLAQQHRRERLRRWWASTSLWPPEPHAGIVA